MPDTLRDCGSWRPVWDAVPRMWGVRWPSWAIATAREKLRAAVGGVAAELVGCEGEAGVPFDRAGEAAGRGLDGGAAVAGVEDQGLDVGGEGDRGVDLGLDVVVEGVLGAGRGRPEQGHRRGDADVGRLVEAVGVAEGGPGSTSRVSRKCAEPNRGAPPVGRWRKFRAP